MIISVDLPADVLETAPKVVLSEFFAEVLRSSRRGQNLVVIRRSTIDWVMEHLELGFAERAQLMRLRSEYTQSATLVRNQSLPAIEVSTLTRAIERVV